MPVESSTALEVPPLTECRPAPPKPQATHKPVPSHLLWCYSGVAPMLMASTWEQHRSRWLVYGLVQAWGWLGSGSLYTAAPLPDVMPFLQAALRPPPGVLLANR